MAKARKVRVLIGDTRPVLRSGLRELLSRELEFSVVGEAESGRETLKMVRELKPEILLLEGLLAAENNKESNVLRQLEAKHKDTRVVVLASSEKEEGLVRALWRAAEVVPKQAPFRSLVQYLRQAEPRSSAPVLERGAPDGEESPKAFAFLAQTRDSSLLSTRERQVVELVSQGFKNKEVAERMFISEQTVKNHLHNIFDKLGVSDRLELVLHAIHKSLFQSSSESS
ncbi:MAG: response regulator transcription factor, partial [Acidobacteria bacterium]|nr:response regulator transcription factor [Acidobacteriota bacterium]